MGQAVKHWRAKGRAARYRRGRVSTGGMSKTELRELGRAAVDGRKITVLPPAESSVPLGPSMVPEKFGGPSGMRVKGDPRFAPESTKKAKESQPAAPKKTSSKQVPIPDIYKDPEKTTLTYKVKSGPNKHDIEIPK